MIELKLKNRKGSFHVNSKEVKDILAERQDIGYLQDISNSINQENIMVFDCELSEKVFSRAEILEAIEELGESVDESFFEIMFDDVRRFLKDTTDEIEAELLPNDKYKKLEQLINKRDPKNKVAFVGDGINDSPVLTLADIGISMGGVGSAAAIEASDVVIMTDELSKILEAIKISKKTEHIIKQNLIFAIGTKILVLVLSIIGVSNMWQAIFADVGVTLITILNTLRILKKR